MNELMPGLSGAPDLHPMFVHFPIVLWLSALGFALAGAARGRDRLTDTARILLYLGTLSALFAATTGYLAAGRMGHDSLGHELVHLHRNYMYVATALALVASIFAFVRRGRSDGLTLWGLTALLLLVSTVTVLGADRGAALVFRYGIGTADETPPVAVPHDDHGKHDHEH